MSAGRVVVLCALGPAVLDWVAVARGWRPAEYVLKPLTLAVVLAGALLLADAAAGSTFALTLAALAFSLAGDVFLMLPGNLFLPGLAAFLLAHLAYVRAFNPSPPPAGPAAAAAVLVAALGAIVFARLRRGMRATGQERMSGPVAVYVVALGAMVVSAAATTGRPGWPAGWSTLAVAGAALFLLSDSLLGWERFVGEVPGGRVAVIVTYHVAQVALVLALLR